MKIYFAAPLFTAAERQWNAIAAAGLRKVGYHVCLPQEVQGLNDSKKVFKKNRDDIDTADAIVAIVDGPDPDSGTSWELGYGYAKGKILIAVHTDFRTAEDFHEPFNLMLAVSASNLISARYNDVEFLVSCIKNVITRSELLRRKE